MSMHIYFGLGSNLGDRQGNLRDALAKLETLGKIERVSSVWETPAWGGVPQPDYLNACVMLEGDVPPLELLRRVKSFEAELGRVPSVRWGERKIDIDVLLMGDMVFHSEELDVPHIRIPERKFVLVPLGEIVPEGWVHPANGKSVNEMLEELADEGEPVRVGSLV